MTQKTFKMNYFSQKKNLLIPGKQAHLYRTICPLVITCCFVLFYLNTVVAIDFDFNCKDHRKGLNEKVKRKVFL